MEDETEEEDVEDCAGVAAGEDGAMTGGVNPLFAAGVNSPAAAVATPLAATGALPVADDRRTREDSFSLRSGKRVALFVRNVLPGALPTDDVASGPPAVSFGSSSSGGNSDVCIGPATASAPGEFFPAGVAGAAFCLAHFFIAAITVGQGIAVAAPSAGPLGRGGPAVPVGPAGVTTAR